MVLIEQDQEGLKSTSGENVVSAFRRVTSDVTESPDTVYQ